MEAVRTTDQRALHRRSPFTIPSLLANLAAGQLSIKYGYKGALGPPTANSGNWKKRSLARFISTGALTKRKSPALAQHLAGNRFAFCNPCALVPRRVFFNSLN